MASPEDVRYSRWLRRAIMLVIGAAAAALGTLLLTAAPASARSVTIPGVGTIDIPDQISAPAIEAPRFEIAPEKMEITPTGTPSDAPVIAEMEFGAQPAMARRALLGGEPRNQQVIEFDVLPEVERLLPFAFPGLDFDTSGGEPAASAPDQLTSAPAPRIEFGAYPGTDLSGEIIELGALPGAADFPPFAETRIGASAPAAAQPSRIADTGFDITASTGGRQFRPATTPGFGVGSLPGVTELAGLARTALGTLPSTDRSSILGGIGIGATPAPGAGQFSPFAGFDISSLPGVMPSPAVTRGTSAGVTTLPAAARLDVGSPGAAPFPAVAGIDVAALPVIGPLADLAGTRTGFGAMPWFGGPEISVDTDTRPAIAQYPSTDDESLTSGFAEQLAPRAATRAEIAASPAQGTTLGEALSGLPFAEALPSMPFGELLEFAMPTELFGFPLPSLGDVLDGRPQVPAPYVAPEKSSGELAVEAARGKLGTNYGMGGTGPDTFDCSGLVQWSYAEAGVATPRTSYDQLAAGTPVSREDLQPGDLVSYYGGGHSALYEGDGKVIHASTYGVGVTESPVDSMPFAGARRF
ncbi:NlpC/P60 family protein [Nocardia sp. NPDC005366]|uniref:C40 family peptidase n=1 Tax=Nocardia sp. NPDC005366 TaxID=3156878 RepID=UPI00339EBF2D